MVWQTTTEVGCGTAPPVLVVFHTAYWCAATALLVTRLGRCYGQGPAQAVGEDAGVPPLQEGAASQLMLEPTRASGGGDGGGGDGGGGDGGGGDGGGGDGDAN